MSPFKLSALFGAALVFGIVAYAPAAKVIPRLVPEGQDLRLFEIAGSIHNGRIGYMQWQKTSAKDLLWTFRPMQLLLLRAAADVSVSDHSRDLDVDNSWMAARVSKSLFSNSVVATDVEFTAPLELLRQALNISFLPVSGQLLVELDSVKIRGQKLVGATGQVRLSQTAWNLGRPNPLGDFEANISTSENIVIAQAKDAESGGISLDARAELDDTGGYKLSAKLKPKTSTPTPLVNMMKELGRTDTNGWYSVQQSGNL